MTISIPSGIRQAVAWFATVVAAYGIMPLQTEAPIVLGLVGLSIWVLYFTKGK
jgi:hypothetical protein